MQVMLLYATLQYVQSEFLPWHIDCGENLLSFLACHGSEVHNSILGFHGYNRLFPWYFAINSIPLKFIIRKF